MDKNAYQRLQDAWVKETGAKAGDTVKVVVAAKSGQLGWNDSWLKEMDASVGKEVTIQHIGDGGVTFKEVSFYFPFFVLEVVDTSEVVKLNSQYSAVVTEKGITVGCQFFSHEKLDELILVSRNIRKLEGEENRIGKKVKYEDLRVGEFGKYRGVGETYEKVALDRLKRVGQSQTMQYDYENTDWTICEPPAPKSRVGQEIPFYQVRVGEKLKFRGNSMVYTRVNEEDLGYRNTLRQSNGSPAFCETDSTMMVTIVE